jgi:HAD superfamily hydrolase (TIGR01484 family)
MQMRVTPKVRAKITALADQIPVGIVSSRDHHDVGWLAADLGFGAPQVSEGGARIFRVGVKRPLWIKSMVAEDARSIVRFLEERRHTFDAVDGNRRVSCAEDIDTWQVTRITANSLTSGQAKSIVIEIGDALANVHTAVIIRTDNGDWMVDFTHAGANKASATIEFARLVGITPAEIVGIGDGYNDLPLLEACGLAVAMGHAPDELVAVADYLAPAASEDGLATAIDEFIAPNLA